jgi:hemolysin-activating ACP:hemolysin acyltransferase
MTTVLEDRVRSRTQNSFYEVFESASEFEPLYFVKYGVAASLAAHSKRAKMPMQYLTEIVQSAINDDRIVFFYNCDSEPVGYYIYAMLAPDVETRISDTGWLAWFAMHHSEWSEGDSLWIVDMVAAPGHGKYILRHIQSKFSAAPINYTRVRNDVVLVGQISPKF